jgi:CRP/FNR family transcriptional regulator, cyclic AMP receptor protein
MAPDSFGVMIDVDLLLACGATYKKVAKGEIIFREGGIASFYHQLVSGKVKWINIDDEGKEYIQYLVQPGESFGELPMFDDEPYAANAVAEEDSLVLRLHRSTFHNLLKEQPQLHFAFSKLLAQRLRFKFMLVKELSCYSPGHRIITLINYLKENNKNYCPKCHKLLLTRQQLANMTGLRVETVIRTIKDLEDQKFLSITKGKVYC